MRRSLIQSGHILYLLLALGGALAYVTTAAEELEPTAPAEEVDGVLAGFNAPLALPTPKKFVGPEGCIECHQAEYLVWSGTNHATNAYDLLRTSSNAKRYAANLGLDADRVTENQRCLACHSTPQGKAAEQTGLILGVTCEACHNGAGGEKGWLNAHATYGPNGVRREGETAAHRQQRIARCRAAGQTRCDDLYALAKRCYECHVIGDEELVVRGGHHPGSTGFEMSSWFDDRIRHNLFLDPRHNGFAPSLWLDPHWRPDNRPGEEINHRRLMYVVAMLVDLEVSLRNRGRAKHASFATASATRIVAASARLTDIAKDETIAELEEALEAVSQLENVLFAPPVEEDADSFFDAARLIRGIAMKISSEDQGERFSSADRLLGSE